MRRTSEKEIKKGFIGFLIFGIIAILMGFIILASPLIPTTPYEEYKEKEVVISTFDLSTGRHRASYYYIITEDGEKFTITGEYSAPQLYQTLIKDTVAVIKYDTNSILPFKKYAEEITVNGNKIVTYNNDAPTNWTPLIIFCLLFCLIGGAFLFFYHWYITHNRKLQSKRDERINKKYGQLKK